MERHRLLVEWNRTEADLPDAATIPALFSRQAAMAPDATALICEQQQITYGELAARAGTLARRLRELGAGPGSTIAVGAPRSPELVVALLGVLQAGAAYLPLDPSYPAGRRRFMLADSGARLCVTGDEAGPRHDPEVGPVAAAGAEDLAYVIYTSGSTGRPKGVAIPHRALANLVLAMRDLLRLTADDRLLAVTTPSFDISALELFVPLVAGATVVLLPEGLAIDGKAVAERLDRHHVSVMQATPAMWRILIDSGWRGRLTTALCGGEALDAGLANRLARRADHVWNVYGPTETTVWSTYAPVAAGAPVTIGRPIANTRLHVLDADLEPAPVGIAGELYIGGAGLARGYVGRSALTAQRFVPDPFATNGERLYRTGDLVRRRPDGTLEFLGRLDHQVKVRGYRVELGEIESALTAHPAVRAAAVTVRGDAQLVAYIVPTDDAPDPRPLSSELRAFLCRSLPDYMVPNIFVGMAALPLSPSGKVDRRALREPDPSIDHAPDRARPRQAVGEPRTGTEQLLAEIWGKVLGLPRVYADDNFFEIGGHSLAVVAVHAQLTELIGREISVVDLFRYPDIRGLAAFLEGDVPAKQTIGRDRAARRIAARRGAGGNRR